MKVSTSWKPSSSSVDILVKQGEPKEFKTVSVKGVEVELPIDAPCLFVKGGLRNCVFGITKYGRFSLWYVVDKGVLYLNTSRQRIAKLTKKAPKQVQAGEFGFFNGDALVMSALPIPKVPDIDYEITKDQAKEKLVEALNISALEYKSRVGDKVALLLSGGTDSTLTLVTLLKMGFDVKTFSVGVSETDFDPSTAKDCAEQLGVEFEFVKLPDTDEELQELLTEAVTQAELSDYSNVLMAMCTLVANKKAKEQGYKHVFHGYLGDVVVGNIMRASAKFNKENPIGSAGRTSEGWRDYRYHHATKITPNTIWIDRLGTHNGMTWGTLFNHHKVFELLLSLPIDILPISGEKYLYWSILDPIVKDGAWHKKRKIGFYTGAGIGKVRLQNPVLSDENMRKTYNTVFAKN